MERWLQSGLQGLGEHWLCMAEREQAEGVA